jgi:hypothetical protein
MIGELVSAQPYWAELGNKKARECVWVELEDGRRNESVKGGRGGGGEACMEKV